MNKKISDKHKRFIDEYVINGFDAQAAYEKIYKVSKSTANSGSARVLSYIEVQEYLNLQKDKMAQAVGIDRKWMIEQYQRIIESCETNGSDGQGTVADRSNWNKALKQLSKLLGLDEPDKVDITMKEFKAKFGN